MSNLYPSPPGISSIELRGLLNAVKNRCCGPAPGLTIGSSDPAKVKSANTTNVCVDGVIATYTTFEVAFTATSDDIAADAGVEREAVYLVLINSAGTKSLYKGTEASGAGAAAVPMTPEGYACIGYCRVTVAAGSTKFDATSDALSAAHITDAYVDLSCNAADWGQ